MTILTTIFWILASLLVGTLAVATVLALVGGGVGLLVWAEQRGVWRVVRNRLPFRNVNFEDVFVLIIIIPMVIFAVMFIGSALLDVSHDEVGWPPVPRWIDNVSENLGD